MKMIIPIFLPFFMLILADEIDSKLNIGYHPMQHPDLFQGDIIGIDNIDERNAIPYDNHRWTNKEVPYVIDAALKPHTDLILEAMRDYHTHTCIRFKLKTLENDYIRLFPGKGCYSNVGMVGGQQVVSLGAGCLHVGTIVHELGHAIGFFHEQNRSDRDQYLIIYWQNIQDGMKDQFLLLKPNENLLLDEFDYNSIMIYGNFAFSRSRKFKTMAAKNDQPLTEPYEKKGLSGSDIKRIKLMYNC